MRPLSGPAVLALLLAVALAFALYPAGRRRAGLVKRKLAGEIPIGWKQLAVGMVPGAPLRSGLREALGWGSPYWIRAMDFADDLAQGFKVHPIVDGRTPSMARFESHFSILQAGQTPHPPHGHAEEEVIVLLSGQLVVIREDAATGHRTEEPAATGELVYHSSENIHTLRAVGPGPARYLVLKWGGVAVPGPDAVLAPKTIPYQQAMAAHEQRAEGFASTLIFEGPTRYLRRLHCHVSTVRPGAGYDPHHDDYDVAIVLLKGTVETVGQRVEAPSVIFYSADEPHGLRNVGGNTAEYVVFEFHGPIQL